MSNILSPLQIATLAWRVGLRGEPLAVSIAVSFAEEGDHDNDALGDVGLEDATWGPSVGLWQIRSLKAEKGQQTFRDEIALHDPFFNAKAMYSISSGGNNFGPWSTFNSGAHLQFLAQAKQLAAQVSSGGSLPDVPGSGATSSSSTTAASVSDTAGKPEDPSTLTAATDDLSSTYQPSRKANALIFTTFGTAAGVLTAGGVFSLALFKDLGPDVSNKIIGGSVDLSAEQISEIRFTVTDPDLVLYQQLADKNFGGTLKVFAITSADPILMPVVNWYDEPLLMASVEIGVTKGVDSFTLVCRTLGAQVFNLERYGIATVQTTDTATNDTTSDQVDLTAALEEACTTAPDGTQRAFQSLIDPSLPGHLVFRNPGDGINPASADPTWGIFQRGSQEVGAWFFAVGNTFYLGRPSWLITKAPKQFKVGWGKGWGGDKRYRPLQTPDLRDARDEIPVIRYCRVMLPRWRGEQIKPGYRMNVDGCGPRFDIAYIVTHVSWDMEDPNSPVTVTGQEPVDPYPTAAIPANKTGGVFGIINRALDASAAGDHRFTWPLGGVVTQEFGHNGHQGIDIGVPNGTPVKAADTGTVAATGDGSSPPFQGYGNGILIDHGNGSATLYGHLQTVQVGVGDHVVKGQQIGLSNNTGHSTGPHLHFEVRQGAPRADPVSMTRKNPRDFINGDPNSVITTGPHSPDTPTAKATDPNA